ncbi:hypothetical protein NQ318_022400 [Aromia moschata]|uniref:Peptidase M14 domain-containing protein n=1 Tax=Aromia moschata TaxID=1265417 RepID=A0AAV8Z6R5_9CUCU|nr:hypothetical protein NQ318_022400 [Aromia moschata]
MAKCRRKRKAKIVPGKKGRTRQTLQACVEKRRYPVRRYETCHDKFLNYQGIKDFLSKVQRSYPNKVQTQVIGRSAEGRAIFMAIISCGGCADQPKMATMIEAGSNGDEWMTVSTALYLIDFLAKNQNLVKIMDYFIIPCSNPDAYEFSLGNSSRENRCGGARKKPDVSMSLCNNFPVLLGTCDMAQTDTMDFLTRLKAWKENYKCNAPETLAVIKAVATYQFATRGGTAITYPFGFTQGVPGDVEDLKKIAKAGQQGLKSRCFEVGSIYSVGGLTYGTIIDFLRTNRSSIKFTYILQVNKKERRLESRKILSLGQDIMSCVKFMARNVYMFYTRPQSQINDCKSFFSFTVSALGKFV